MLVSKTSFFFKISKEIGLDTKTETVGEIKTRPCHQTVKSSIRSATNESLPEWATFLKATTIPFHGNGEEIDEIINEWQSKIKSMCWGEDSDLGVTEALLRQKQAAKEKHEREASVMVELADLQKKMETFLSASHNHHLSGNGNKVAWQMHLRKQLQDLHQLISKVLEK